MSDEGNGDAPVDTVVLDVDGTLVDTVYLHTLLWSEAFRAVGVDVPMWRLHRTIGMGGDRLVAHVCDDDVEREHGDEIRDRHDGRFGELIDDVRPLPGAAELVEELRRRGLKVVLASSGLEEHTRRLLGAFGGEQAEGWTSSDDVESSKPAPDLLVAAIEKVRGRNAVVVGDAVWDIAAAEEAGLGSIGLLCGGFAESELLDAGADLVFESPRDLLDHIDQTPL